MAKANTPPKVAAPAVAASSNWTNLKQALHRTASSSPDRSSSPRKRRRASSLGRGTARTIVASPRSPLNGDSKGKGKATPLEVEHEHEHDLDGNKHDKKTKGMVPVEDLLKGNVAGWQMDVGQYLAIDCEMVGVGPEGVESTLARVSIVNYHGHLMYDSFVKPREKVTDYRTWVSGVREEDLLHAPTFAHVINKVSELIKGRILIGHAISNDTQVLLLSHPHHLTRDTSKYAPLQALARTKRPSLKTLSKLVLGVDIQSGEHSSIDDARATMAIYRSQKPVWEDAVRTKVKPTLVYSTTEPLKKIEKEGGIESVPKHGGGKKDSTMVRKGMGVAQTLRLVRAQQEFGRNVGGGEQGEGGEGGVDQEVLEARQRKKARVEEEEGFVLGFDYTPAPVPVSIPTTKVAVESSSSKMRNERRTVAKKKVRKVSAGGGVKKAGVDSEKRPQSKEGWWEED